MSERPTFYVIQVNEHQDSFYNGSFWSNEAGWVPLNGADVFTYTEMISFGLPMYSEWMELPPIPETK